MVLYGPKKNNGPLPRRPFEFINSIIYIGVFLSCLLPLEMHRVDLHSSSWSYLHSVIVINDINIYVRYLFIHIILFPFKLNTF